MSFNSDTRSTMSSPIGSNASLEGTAPVLQLGFDLTKRRTDDAMACVALYLNGRLWPLTALNPWTTSDPGLRFKCNPTVLANLSVTLQSERNNSAFTRWRHPLNDWIICVVLNARVIPQPGAS
jgi:hypothetical protein